MSISAQEWQAAEAVSAALFDVYGTRDEVADRMDAIAYAVALGVADYLDTDRVGSDLAIRCFAKLAQISFKEAATAIDSRRQEADRS